MKHEEVIKLQPGKDIDTLVNEIYEKENGPSHYVPPYSREMQAAWKLAESISKKWPDFNVCSRWNESDAEFDGWYVVWGMDGYGTREVRADSASLAICYAFILAAQEEEEWEK